jgi:hypothetical protein
MARQRKLFTVGNHQGNVVLNYFGHPINQFALIASSYAEAATVLRKKFEAERHIDFDAYPIVFLYRHALELYLKAVLLLGNQLAVTSSNTKLHTDDIFTSHSLSDNLPVVKEIFAEVGWGDDYPHMGLEDASFEAIVKEFDELDRGSYTFRYTVKKDGTASIEEHFAFSISDFAAIMERILSNLSGACIGLEEISGFMAEQYREAMSDYMADMRADMHEYESDYRDY